MALRGHILHTPESTPDMAVNQVSLSHSKNICEKYQNHNFDN